MSKKIYKYEFKNEYKLMIDIIEYTKDKKKVYKYIRNYIS